MHRLPELRAMGTGSFVSVAQGSDDNEACIVHLTYKPAQVTKKKFALVAKGACMDTGGYNVRSDADMQHMHEDISGSAVVLALLTAVSTLKLPCR